MLGDWRIAALSREAECREWVRQEYGRDIDTYDTDEAQEVFEFDHFLYGMPFVIRKSDRVKGVLWFAEKPGRIYFWFREMEW